MRVIPLLKRELPTPSVQRFRAVVADDHAEMRAEICTLLGTNIQVVASVGDGISTIEAVEKLDPDLLILDITMPGMNGIEVARELAVRGCRAKVVFVTLDDSRDIMAAALAAGAAGYVIKSQLQFKLKETVRRVLQDGLAHRPL